MVDPIVPLPGLLGMQPQAPSRRTTIFQEIADPPIADAPTRGRNQMSKVQTYDGGALLDKKVGQQFKETKDRRRTTRNLTAAEVYGLSKERKPAQALDAVRDYNDQNLDFVSPRQDTMVDPKNLAAMASLGAAKKGWYEASNKAIMQVFGKNDGSRFIALLSATSPQTSVELNLLNTLSIWRNWVNAGRPKDRTKIIKVMGMSVQGDKGEGSVLPAWKNNAVRALTQKDPTKIKISGPKVQSFYENLMGDLNEVTNDTWMGRAMNVLQGAFSGKKTKVTTERQQDLLGTRFTFRGPEELGVKNTSYLALNDATREAAQILTKQTGIEWTPAHVQESVWSYVKTAVDYAKSKESGEMNVEDVINEGVITGEMIGSTPDFATLLLDPTYGSKLEGIQDDVVLNNLATLQPGTFGAANIPVLYPERVPKIANMLLDVTRAKEDTGSIYLPYESVPGEASGMFSGLLETTPAMKRLAREYSADPRSDYDDPSGVDRLATLAADKAAKPTRDAFGAYTNSAGVLENNPVRIARVEFGEGNKKAEEDAMMEKMGALQAFRGAMDIQEGSPVSFPTPMRTPGGSATSARIYLDGPIGSRQYKALEMRYPTLEFADTGNGVTVSNYDFDRLQKDPEFRSQVEAEIEMLIDDQAFLNRTFGKGTRARKTNMEGDYIDYSKELATPNEGRVARSLLERFKSPSLSGLKTRMGSDEMLRQMVQEKVDRDEEFKSRRKIGPLRQDVQNLRRAFSGSLSEDYPEMEGAGGFQGIEKALELGIPLASRMSALDRFRAGV